jgi:sugar/nucleoside kinase (ribokinase family)
MVRIRPPYRSRPSPSLTLYDCGVHSIVSVGGIAEEPLREAAIFASAAAALAARSLGAQTSLPTRAELERWLAAHVNH